MLIAQLERSCEDQESSPSGRRNLAALPQHAVQPPKPKKVKADLDQRQRKAMTPSMACRGHEPAGTVGAQPNTGPRHSRSTAAHRNQAWRDNAIKYEQNGSCFLATKLLALWDFMLNGMKKNPICFEAH